MQSFESSLEGWASSEGAGHNDLGRVPADRSVRPARAAAVHIGGTMTKPTSLAGPGSLDGTEAVHGGRSNAQRGRASRGLADLRGSKAGP